MLLVSQTTFTKSRALLTFTCTDFVGGGVRSFPSRRRSRALTDSCRRAEAVDMAEEAAAFTITESPSTRTAVAETTSLPEEVRRIRPSQLRASALTESEYQQVVVATS